MANKPLTHYDAVGLEIDSPSNTLTQAILRGDVEAVKMVLEAKAGGLTQAQIASARAFLASNAQCLAVHATYKNLNCRGCGGDCVTKEDAMTRAACLTAEVAGRTTYLALRCDYVLAGSILRGSAIAENGHRIQLAAKIAGLAKCTNKIAILPSIIPPPASGAIPSLPLPPAGSL